MKHLVITLCIAGSALALAACESTQGTTNTEANVPYAVDRTAGGEEVVQERTFRRVQTK